MARHLGKAIVHNLELLDRLAELQPTYVIGNHDADLAAMIGRGLLNHRFFESMSGPFTRSIGGKSFKFMHGHEVDPFNSSADPSWGRMLAIFAGIFEEKNGSPMLEGGETVEEALDGIGQGLLRVWNWIITKFKKSVTRRGAPNPKDEFTPAQNPSRTKEMIAKYAEDRQAEGYDVAIVGHTHQPGRVGEWYLNSGCWAAARNSFVRISPEGDARVFDWVSGDAEPCDTVLQEDGDGNG